MVAVSFIGGGNWSTRRKPLTNNEIMILNIYGILIKVKLNRHNRHCRMKNVNCIKLNRLTPLKLFLSFFKVERKELPVLIFSTILEQFL
jgi:hypothetical protein